MLWSREYRISGVELCVWPTLAHLGYRIARFGGKQKMSDASHMATAVRRALGNRSIVMVGMMGCGKTAVGRRLATALDLKFVDADDEIEKAADMSISEIFTSLGEAHFRDGERRVIARLLSGGPQVLATGGGAFMNQETRDRVARQGISIWLRAELGILMRRVGRRENRPMLKTPDPEKRMRELLAVRNPVYALADVTIDSREVAHDLVVADILAKLCAGPLASQLDPPAARPMANPTAKAHIGKS